VNKHYKFIPIGNDGWPVEMIEGRPLTNFLRRLIHTDHYECEECWYRKQQAASVQGAAGGGIAKP
jgi:hypothetical protein